MFYYMLPYFINFDIAAAGIKHSCTSVFSLLHFLYFNYSILEVFLKHLKPPLNMLYKFVFAEINFFK